MEFFPAGLAVSVAVLAPNLLLLRYPPREPLPRVEAPAALRWLERAGQASCLVLPALSTPAIVAPWWIVPLVAALLGYYALWARYLFTGRAGSSLYWWRGVPAPMAVLPVAVFATTAGWLGDPWIAVAAAVLAAGHIPIALLTARAVAGHG